MIDALRTLQRKQELKTDPMISLVAAVSVGIYKGEPVLDLDYAEDSTAETDMNVIMTDQGGFIEVQGTAEGKTFAREELDAMLKLAEQGIGELAELQRQALAE